MKKALICGISGQDGAYLAKFLLERGYEVCGTSRDAQMSSFKNLVALGIRDRVKLYSMSLTDFRSVLQVLDRTQPSEVYNLSGQSSVGLSFDQPVETLDSIATGTLNLLEVIRFIGSPIKFYNAGSSECFGDTQGTPADEQTPFRPRSPYGVAKATAFWEVANYREPMGFSLVLGFSITMNPPAAGTFCHPENRSQCLSHRSRESRPSLLGQHQYSTRLGLGPGIYPGHALDAATGCCRRLRDCYGTHL